MFCLHLCLCEGMRSPCEGKAHLLWTAPKHFSSWSHLTLVVSKEMCQTEQVVSVLTPLKLELALAKMLCGLHFRKDKVLEACHIADIQHLGTTVMC